MKTILILLTLLLLVVGAAAEQTIYYHYIDIYSRPSNGPTREQVNDPFEVKLMIKRGWKITHVAASASNYGYTVVVYILEKESASNK